MGLRRWGLRVDRSGSWALRSKEWFQRARTTGENVRGTLLKTHVGGGWVGAEGKTKKGLVQVLVGGDVEVGPQHQDYKCRTPSADSL